MKIVTARPPNYHQLSQVFDLPEGALFPWGDTLYNPSGADIPADIEWHEMVHQRQQGDNPEMWWSRYIYDPEFRLDQELEAYAEQYLFVKGSLNDKAAKDCLDEIAANLASAQYGFNMTIHEAATLVRLRARAMV